MDSRLLSQSIPCLTVMVLILVVTACDPGTIGESADWISQSGSPIINPTAKATSYPESALVDMGAGLCSGSVIAPRVVMTAGHCVTGISSWRVTTPYAKDANGKPQTRTASGAWTDYESWGNWVNPNTPDVGLVFFDAGSPFKLTTWPKIQQTQLSNGTKAMNVGRVNNGQLSSSDLFVGAPVTLNASSQFKYSYASKEVIQSGDSGGPVFLPGGQPHTIVAVNSGGGGGQILARTDVVANKIEQLINQHGGPGQNQSDNSDQDNDTGDSNDGNDNNDGLDDPSGDCNTNEAEPNEPYSQAQEIFNGSLCGSLGSIADSDWFSWDVSSAGVDYDVTVSGNDTRIAMWKKVNGYYYRISNNSNTRITNTSTGPGTYFIVVWSPSGATGDYHLNLKRSDKSDTGNDTSLDLCAGCSTSAQCGGPNDYCLHNNTSGEKFCSRDCSLQSCPSPYMCTSINTSTGWIEQCIPPNATCQ